MKPYKRRVQYYETDMMGIAHHANYIHWMEEARIDFMDQLGYSYAHMEEQGVFSPVLSLACEYKHPCVFNDVILITVSVAGFNGARLMLRYEMKKDEQDELICIASSEHAFMDQKGQILRLKRAVPELSHKIELLAEHNEPTSSGNGKASEAEYRFYGWQNVTPTVLNLYNDIRKAWCAETCAPRMREDWSEDNPSLGQCSITSFLVQDLLGGTVYGIPLETGGVHCYNVVDNMVFDLASEQFGDRVLNYVGNPEQIHEEHFADQDKYERYLLLKKRLFDYQKTREAL